MRDVRDSPVSTGKVIRTLFATVAGTLLCLDALAQGVTSADVNAENENIRLQINCGDRRSETGDWYYAVITSCCCAFPKTNGRSAQ